MTARRAAIVGGVVVGALLVVVLAVSAVLWTVQRDRVLPNTLVEGVDVGGLTRDQLDARLATIDGDNADHDIVVAFEDQELVLSPLEVGYRYDRGGAAAEAFGRGRQGLPGDIVTRLGSLWSTRDIPIEHRWDDQALRAWVDETATNLDRGVSDGEVRVDEQALEVVHEPPRSGVTVRRDELHTRLADALRSAPTAALELSADIEPPRVDATALEAVARQLEGAIAGPLELSRGDVVVVLEPAEIARLAEVTLRAGTGDRLEPELVVTPERATAVLEPHDVVDLTVDAIDAGYVVDRAPPVSHTAQGSTSFSPVEHEVGIEPGRDGAWFDADVAAERLTELLREGAREAELPLATEPPEFSSDMAEELRPTHLLGTFTTFHPAGEARVRNIQRLADEVDGAVVLPGEQFSINGISGRRTCEGGYVEAGTIVRGELVPTCGGGTSQFGTTTYNAAFFAGVQIDQWRPHSWYIGRYPMGREATINYPELDVKFTNTTPGAIVVKTTYTSGSITVSLYGQPIAREVRATLGQPHSHRSFTEQRRLNNSLAPGRERVVQGGGGGFTVSVTRTIVLLDGTTREQTDTTVYVPQTRIVEHGPPAPEPDPPGDTDQPTDGPPADGPPTDPPAAGDEGA